MDAAERHQVLTTSDVAESAVEGAMVRAAGPELVIA